MKYVELNQKNFKVFSNDFANQLLSIGSELDVIMKVVSGYDQQERVNINDYAKIILGKYPNIINQEVIVNNKSLIIKPFDGWTINAPSQNLSCWNNYNKVKHGRFYNYEEANLENVLFILACLFVLEMYYIKSIADVDKEPDIPDYNLLSRLFILKNWTTAWLPHQGLMLKICQK